MLAKIWCAAFGSVTSPDLCCVALSGTQRGILHVILTTGNNSALQVSPEAEQFLRLDHPNLTKFVSKFEQGNISHNINGFSDTRDVATAVNAQIECLTPALGELGMHLLPLFGEDRDVLFCSLPTTICPQATEPELWRPVQIHVVHVTSQGPDDSA